jgi:hypothetical protein
LCFSQQAFVDAAALLGIGEIAEADSFDGDGASDGGIERFIDDTHRAAAEFFDDLIPADLLHAPSV